MQHFHATIVIQHVSSNKINFMQLISYNKTCFMPNISCFVQQKQFFAKYFMQQKLFHETFHRETQMVLCM